MTRRAQYDYIIVGAGAAGCVLANRLTENDSANVLVLEAGGWDRDPWIHIPLGWGRLLKKRLKTRPDSPLPDTQMIFNASTLAAAPYLSPVKKPFQDGFSARVVLLRPASRGRVDLASVDPAFAPRIIQNFLSAPDDLSNLRRAVRTIQTIAYQPEMKDFLGEEIAPGRNATDAELDKHIRTTAITVHLPLGTCKMGLPADEDAVVDEQLRVFGVESLRVVDASAMPDLVGGNINASVTMIAERAADSICGRPWLAATVVPSIDSR